MNYYEPKIIYEKVCSGASLSDDEINSGVLFYKDLSDKLFSCGDVFRLAAVEANRIHYKLDGFQKARREK